MAVLVEGVLCGSCMIPILWWIAMWLSLVHRDLGNPLKCSICRLERGYLQASIEYQRQPMDCYVTCVTQMFLQQMLCLPLDLQQDEAIFSPLSTHSELLQQHKITSLVSVCPTTSQCQQHTLNRSLSFIVILFFIPYHMVSTSSQLVRSELCSFISWKRQGSIY